VIRVGRVLRQNQYVSKASSKATTNSPEITSATTVPVLSDVVAAPDELATESWPPGTNNGPPFGAVSPGATDELVTGSVVVVVVVVFFVCALATCGTRSKPNTSAATIRVRLARCRFVMRGRIVPAASRTRESGLMDRTRVRRASPDRAARQCGAVLRASSPAHTGELEIAHVRAATLVE
jgi:hypothetical protein